jgi:signal transduction histidine kinase/CheY-like chemotaxis protein
VLARQTAQAEASHAFARAEEIETIISHMADGVMIFDERGLLLRINPAGQRLMGRGVVPGAYPELHSTAYGICNLAGEQLATEDLPVVKALNGESVTGVQLLVKRPRGDDMIIRASASPLYEREGRVTGAVMVFHDITQEKLVERLKDEFLSVVSHELRTPLTAIMGYSDLLLRGIHGPMAERHSRPVRAIKSNAQRLLSLINDLLDVSRLESGMVEMVLEPVDLGDAIARTITRTRVLAVDAAVTVQNNVPRRGFPKALSNDTRLQQIVENLLANAIKFTPRGGNVTFDVAVSPLSADDPAIADSVLPDQPAPDLAAPESIVVSVTDTGAGLQPDQLERIWDRFYQVDSTSRRRTGGAGLGLAIVRSLVELHGGHVWARSAGRDKGSTFSFSLPLASGHADEPPFDEPVPVPVAAQISDDRPLGIILVVEDHPDQREIICDMLESEGYNVVLAEDGEEALELAHDVRPVAMVLDVLLPRADGWEVLDRLRSDPEIQDIPVLITSVVDQESFGRRLGADEYLVKPLNQAKLRLALQRMTGAGHTHEPYR